MVKMIITDLDNTLLRSDKSISEYTVAVLKKCQAAGIKIVFATARSTQASVVFLDRFMPDVFIGYGGALVLAGDVIIHRFDIPADIANQIIKECLEMPGITGIRAINESVALSNNPEPDMTHYQYTDFTRERGNRYLKISLNASDPVVVENIALHFPMCDMLRYTGEDLYRFANRDAVKWNAVNAIAEYYDCDTDTFVAFGDDINDLEMIQKCGTGIAVKNAIRQVQSVAKYICEANDNDGVAKWIEQHLLCTPPANSTPVPGTKKYIDGVLHVWVPGFGYVPHSGDNIVTYAEDMYESGVKIGIMGGDEPSARESASPQSEQPEPTGNVIYALLQPPVTKNSTPPPYKPNGESYNP